MKSSAAKKESLLEEIERLDLSREESAELRLIACLPTRTGDSGGFRPATEVTWGQARNRVRICRVAVAALRARYARVWHEIARRGRELSGLLEEVRVGLVENGCPKTHPFRFLHVSRLAVIGAIRPEEGDWPQHEAAKTVLLGLQGLAPLPFSLDGLSRRLEAAVAANAPHARELQVVQALLYSHERELAEAEIAFDQVRARDRVRLTRLAKKLGLILPVATLAPALVRLAMVATRELPMGAAPGGMHAAPAASLAVWFVPFVLVLAVMAATALAKRIRR